jgi:hypothetical protein
MNLGPRVFGVPLILAAIVAAVAYYFLKGRKTPLNPGQGWQVALSPLGARGNPGVPLGKEGSATDYEPVDFSFQGVTNRGV